MTPTSQVCSPLSPAQCAERLRGETTLTLLHDRKRAIGFVTSSGFSLILATQAFTQGNLAPTVKGAFVPIAGGTAIRITVRRSVVLMMPGFQFLFAGAVGALIVLASLVGGTGWTGHGSLPLVLGLAVLPFGLVWFAFGLSLGSATDLPELIAFLGSVFESVPCQSQDMELASGHDHAPA